MKGATLKLDMTVSSPFRYLWLKHVTGVSLSKHCASCLKGEYSKDVGPNIPQVSGLELPDGVWYLCGVSKPYRWDRNFHLAFHDCPGKIFTFEWNGIAVRIEGAEHLPISEEFIDPSDPNAEKREYRTCRNWQFAHWLKSHGRHLLLP